MNLVLSEKEKKKNPVFLAWLFSWSLYIFFALFIFLFILIFWCVEYD